MEMDRFDDLTRRLSGAGSSRRQALRALAGALLGSALGGVAARLAIAEGVETKPTRHKPKQQRPFQGEWKAQRSLQAEGKRKGKKGGQEEAAAAAALHGHVL